MAPGGLCPFSSMAAVSTCLWSPMLWPSVETCASFEVSVFSEARSLCSISLSRGFEYSKGSKVLEPLVHGPNPFLWSTHVAHFPPVCDLGLKDENGPWECEPL